jgi:hypothetical protein
MLKLFQLLFILSGLIGIGTIDITTNQRLNYVLTTFWQIISMIYMIILFSTVLETNTESIIDIFFINELDYKLFKLVLIMAHNFMIGFVDPLRTNEFYFNMFLLLVSDSLGSFVNSIYRTFLFFDLFRPIVIIVYNNLLLGKSYNSTSKYFKSLCYGSQLLAIVYFLNIGLMLVKHN